MTDGASLGAVGVLSEGRGERDAFVVILRIEFSLAVNQTFEVSRSLEEVSRSLGSCFHEWC